MSIINEPYSEVSKCIFALFLPPAFVSGKQNIESGEIDTRSLKLIELIDYDPKFDSDYLNDLISKAKKSWKGINPDEWLLNLRGGYEV